MGLYSLVGLVFMMLAAVVVTREPNEDSDFIDTGRKKKGAGQARRRSGGSLSMAGGPHQR